MFTLYHYSWRPSQRIILDLLPTPYIFLMLGTTVHLWNGDMWVFSGKNDAVNGRRIASCCRTGNGYHLSVVAYLSAYMKKFLIDRQLQAPSPTVITDQFFIPYRTLWILILSHSKNESWSRRPFISCLIHSTQPIIIYYWYYHDRTPFLRIERL